MKIKWKLLLYILLPLLAVILAANAFIYYKSIGLLEEEADAYLLSQAEVIKHDSEHTIADAEHSLYFLLHNHTISEYFVYSNLGLSDKAEDKRREVERDFLKAAQHIPEFITLRVSPLQGKSIVDIVDQKISHEHYDLSSTQWFQDALKEPAEEWIVTYGVCKEHKESGLVFAATFADDAGEKLGVASIHVHVKGFFKKLFGTKIGKSGYFYLLDDMGAIVAHSNQDRVGARISDPNELGKLISSEMQLIVGLDPVTKVPVRKAVVPLSIDGLHLIVAQPVSEIHAANDELFYTDLLIILFAACVITLVSLIVANKFARPIVRLKDMAVTVGAGDLDAKVDIISKDEIGELASSFNKMVADLRHTTTSIDNLNHEIREREKVEKERVALEQQLRQKQKLESIGTLAAGVAHEINTPIQFIGNNTRFFNDAVNDVMELLNLALKVVEEYEEHGNNGESLRVMKEKQGAIDFDFLTEEMPLAASQTLDGVERVAEIVRALRDFSHMGSEEKSPENINDAIENTIMIAHNVWKQSAELKTDFDQELPLVRCTIGDIKQVILNLIINATHAITAASGTEDNDGAVGTISIVTRKIDGDVIISVSDTGTGIPESMCDKVFDPFFTTKEVGQGSGQGLAFAYKTIVDKHNGDISFETEEGQGTTFFIRLPIN